MSSMSTAALARLVAWAMSSATRAARVGVSTGVMLPSLLVRSTRLVSRYVATIYAPVNPLADTITSADVVTQAALSAVLAVAVTVRA